MHKNTKRFLRKMTAALCACLMLISLCAFTGDAASENETETDTYLEDKTDDDVLDLETVSDTTVIAEYDHGEDDAEEDREDIYEDADSPVEENITEETEEAEETDETEEAELSEEAEEINDINADDAADTEYDNDRLTFGEYLTGDCSISLAYASKDRAYYIKDNIRDSSGNILETVNGNKFNIIDADTPTINVQNVGAMSLLINNLYVTDVDSGEDIKWNDYYSGNGTEGYGEMVQISDYLYLTTYDYYSSEANKNAGKLTEKILILLDVTHNAYKNGISQTITEDSFNELVETGYDDPLYYSNGEDGLGTFIFESDDFVVNNELTDFVITIDSASFYGSFLEDYVDYYEGRTGYVEPGMGTYNGKYLVCIGLISSSGFWIGENYASGEYGNASTYEGAYTANRYSSEYYTYPCVENISLTVTARKHNASLTEENDGLIHWPFLEAVSDIDVYWNPGTDGSESGNYGGSYQGYYSESFSTIDGFSNEYYLYDANECNIMSTSPGVVTIQATYAVRDGTSGNDSYSKTGLYAVTDSSGIWSVSYIDGWCATQISIYADCWDMTLLKTSATDGTPLKNAEFELYYMDDDGTKYYYDYEDGSSSWTSEECSSIKTDETGYASIYSIPANTYYLVETKAPSGYQISTSEPIIFNISISGTITLLDSENIASVNDDNTGLNIVVQNIPTEYDMPETGGTGYASMTFIACCTITMGILLLLFCSKRNKTVNHNI